MNDITDIAIKGSVEKIISDVRKNKDKAILKYNRLFDKNKSIKFQLSKKQIHNAYKIIGEKKVKLFKRAIRNIKLFSNKQVHQYKNFEITIDKNKIGQRIVPIEKVGVYVPGGKYPLPSTAIMGVTPAKIVGCKEIVVCSPNITPEIIVAADLSGAMKIFNVGGVQAIAGMAIGTKQIPKIDKIIGPGNQYVTEAKRQLNGVVGIDFLAGPTELCIVADQYSKPELIAADLLAQAEHDANARTFLICTNKKIIRRLKIGLKNQLKNLKTKNIAEISINSLKIFKIKNISDSIKIVNDISPEHLSLQIREPERIVNELINYGSLFLGENSAEVFGDYFSGTNHILPTSKASRYTGGLSVANFIKVLTYQEITKKGLKRIKDIAEMFADIEGLDGHKKSSKIRKLN